MLNHELSKLQRCVVQINCPEAKKYIKKSADLFKSGETLNSEILTKIVCANQFSKINEKV
jgi:hypothetical protein